MRKSNIFVIKNRRKVDVEKYKKLSDIKFKKILLKTTTTTTTNK